MSLKLPLQLIALVGLLGSRWSKEVVAGFQSRYGVFGMIGWNSSGPLALKDPFMPHLTCEVKIVNHLYAKRILICLVWQPVYVARKSNIFPSADGDLITLTLFCVLKRDRQRWISNCFLYFSWDPGSLDPLWEPNVRWIMKKNHHCTWTPAFCSPHPCTQVKQEVIIYVFASYCYCNADTLATHRRQNSSALFNYWKMQ